jgi:hypothetical protein
MVVPPLDSFKAPLPGRVGLVSKESAQNYYSQIKQTKQYNVQTATGVVIRITLAGSTSFPIISSPLITFGSIA